MQLGITLLRCSLILLVLACRQSLPVAAQQADPALQGRVFQGDDGVLWLYKDGVKYAIQGLDLSQEQIDAIPLAGSGPIARVDTLFGSSPPSAPAPGAPQPPASSDTAGAAPVSPPTLEVANPSPADPLAVGGLSMQGFAFDPSANQQEVGVDRVQVFLEDRDQGGTYLGDATLGQASPHAAGDTQFGHDGWQVTVNLPAGAHTLFVYARSSVTGSEAVVAVPVLVGVVQ